MATRGDELRAYLFAKRLDELGSCLRRTSYRDLDTAGAVAREPGVGGVVAEVQCDLVRDDAIPTGFFPSSSPPHLRGLQFGTKPARGIVKTDPQTLTIPRRIVVGERNVVRSRCRGWARAGSRSEMPGAAAADQ